MRGLIPALCAALLFALSPNAHAQSAKDRELRAIYEELVEIDTSAATGSCTRAAEAMAARLRAVGFPEADVTIVTPPNAPEDGNLVAIYRASRPRAGAGPILLLAHLDVVEARRADWERDPYTLVEEEGFFYGRGATDDKAMAAVFVDLFLRFRRENFRTRRDIKLALTCGEETSDTVNGVQYLLQNHRELVQADFAINEGASGRLDAAGHYVMLELQAGEKIHQVYTLEVTNPGGHSSRPRPDNAIYSLAGGLQRLAAYHFPVELNDTTRAFFQRMSGVVGGDMGEAMRALAANPADQAAAAQVARDAQYNSMMRTTCVATRLDAGHAINALPQRARATLSCRVLQGHTAEEVKADLERVLADPAIRVTIERRREGSPAPQLTPEIMGPVERAAARLWPRVPVVPTMTTGATDGRFFNSAGIPTYGMSGMFQEAEGNNAHGLNERLRVRSFYEGQRFLERVVRDYAD
jgi:acetylornithine deacetylase/succinyl-diaminopimelate desuccinylase-like protein